MTDNRHDDDPTGMRRLLAGMGEPRPMSPDLIADITHRLEAEDSRRSAATCRFDPSFDTPRRRPRIVIPALFTTGVVVIATAVTVVALRGEEPTAALGATLIKNATAPAPAPTAAPLDASTPTPGSAPKVTVYASGADYTRGHLTEQVSALLERRSVDTEHTTNLNSTLSPQALSRCLRGLSLDHVTALVDSATFHGHPALVVVADHAPGGRAGHTVAVLPRTCDDGNATPLAGPFSVH